MSNLPLSAVSRRCFVGSAAGLAAGFATGGAFAAADSGKRPNILFIMTDDHASQALSCYGSKINQTPHLDGIAKEGMRMDRVFATNSICTPSRATILTGKIQSPERRSRAQPLLMVLSPPLQEMLQRVAGYYTWPWSGNGTLGSDPTGLTTVNILPGQGVYNDPVLYDKDGSVQYKGYADRYHYRPDH